MLKNIGVDLGTSNTLIYLKGKGIVLNEPSVVAIHSDSGRILAVGGEAKDMIGRTSEEISVIRPMQDGVVANFDVAQAMLKSFMERVNTGSILRPSVTVCVPYGITEVEHRAATETIIRAGGKNAHVLEKPIAAAIGADLPVREAVGSMIVDIGGGTCEAAVISFGGIVACTSVHYAGDKLNADIVDYVKNIYNTAIGERTAEEIKIRIGRAYHSCEEKNISVMGRDLKTGLPKQLTITSSEVEIAIADTLEKIISAIRDTLEHTPPELVSDIVNRGILLVGGGAKLLGLDLLLKEKVGIVTNIAEKAEECVAIGAGTALLSRTEVNIGNHRAKPGVFSHR